MARTKTYAGGYLHPVEVSPKRREEEKKEVVEEKEGKKIRGEKKIAFEGLQPSTSTV